MIPALEHKKAYIWLSNVSNRPMWKQEGYHTQDTKSPRDSAFDNINSNLHIF